MQFISEKIVATFYLEFESIIATFLFSFFKKEMPFIIHHLMQ